ncbi:NUDIX domain-containing protein [Candidatus Microgenomates bacterium]|nr:NUDIX domain-containing protein [Candidatus Microgenomates bacterium]
MMKSKITKVNLYQAQSIPGWPYHVSAGGVVFKHLGGESLFALLYRGPKWHGEESWHLPKGTLALDETLLECAQREIKEEAGLDGELWGYLGSVVKGEKWSGGYYEKTTHYFLFKHLSGDGSAMDSEHDRLEWHEAQAAHDKLASGRTGLIKAEQDIIYRATELLKLVSQPPNYE